jgi:hypothetical protein
MLPCEPFKHSFAVPRARSRSRLPNSLKLEIATAFSLTETEPEVNAQMLNKVSYNFSYNLVTRC